MKWSRGTPFEDSGPGPVGVKSFGLVGIEPNQIVELHQRFATRSREDLTAFLREQTGHPWAAHTLSDLWEEDELEARRRGLFDCIWHRRAMQVDPMVTAPDFAGFDVLMDVARDVAPECAKLLTHVNAASDDNERRRSGPDWWRAWHEATETRPGGWLTPDEAACLAREWQHLATPEVELACLEIMGATYTHSGCWALLSNLGGFFAQCASEDRSVVCEVDL